MLKVLQFPVRNNKGGVTKYILDHWRYIDKSKFHFDFVTLNKSLPFEKELSDEGAKVYHITCTAEQDEEDFKDSWERSSNRDMILYISIQEPGKVRLLRKWQRRIVFQE